MKTALCVAALLGLCAPPVGSQTVGLSGMLGSKALVIVDGSPPKAVAPGETFRGVKIISTQSDQAVVDIAGQRHTLRIGDAPANVGGIGSNGTGTRIVLTSSGGGHFVTLGQINGRSAEMVIDTGASAVSMGSAQAERLGIEYKSGQMVQMSTANGVIPGWRIKLKSVKVGDVTLLEIDAVVSSGSMPYVLLGNSFLTRFQMTRTNDQLVLDKRY
ncbi:MAG: TIGR02281 family clan AA aspartic protease [Burkholderiales bacterium PBB3]|nr:MAG: TIGR02281 family clan AA aspartic protease [Burkholderiales bacterium PBB3]